LLYEDIGGCADTPCYDAIQALQGTDLFCYSAQTGKPVEELKNHFVEILKGCDDTTQPFAADAALRDTCGDTFNKLGTGYYLCVDQNCADGCLDHIKTVTADDMTTCLANYYFSGSAFYGAQWFQSDMYAKCGGTGTFALAEAFPNDPTPQIDDLWAWAPGGGPLMLPSDVGIDLGAQGYTAIGMQMHYDNPNLVPDLTDNSGVTVYYTETPRAQSAGMLQLGDKNVEMNAEPVKPASVTTELVEHTITCPSEATEFMLGTTTITLATSFPHMHEEGFFMSTTVCNKEGALKHEFRVEYYDGGFQGSLDANIEITPGDSFTTRCVYKPKAEAMFGLGSDEEMCIDFMMYYPVNDQIQSAFSGACGVEKKGTDLEQSLAANGFEMHKITGILETALNRRFAQPAGSCTTSLSATTTTTSVPEDVATTTAAATTSAATQVPFFASVFLAVVLACK